MVEIYSVDLIYSVVLMWPFLISFQGQIYNVHTVPQTEGPEWKFKGGHAEVRRSTWVASPTPMGGAAGADEWGMGEGIPSPAD